MHHSPDPKGPILPGVAEMRFGVLLEASPTSWNNDITSPLRNTLENYFDHPFPADRHSVADLLYSAISVTCFNYVT